MNQKGFTLLEMLLVISITGAIALIIGSSYVQIVLAGPRVREGNVALNDIDSALHWLTRDLTLAQSTSLMDGAPPMSSMTMTWSDRTAWAGDEGSVSHSASYALLGTQLLRTYDGEETIIGRQVTDVAFSRQGKLFTVTQTSGSGWTGSPVTRSFLIQMRSDLP